MFRGGLDKNALKAITYLKEDLVQLEKGNYLARAHVTSIPKDELHVPLHLDVCIRAGFKPPFRPEYAGIFAKHLLAPQ